MANSGASVTNSRERPFIITSRSLNNLNTLFTNDAFCSVKCKQIRKKILDLSQQTLHFPYSKQPRNPTLRQFAGWLADVCVDFLRIFRKVLSRVWLFHSRTLIAKLPSLVIVKKFQNSSDSKKIIFRNLKIYIFCSKIQHCRKLKFDIVWSTINIYTNIYKIHKVSFEWRMVFLWYPLIATVNMN